MPAAKKPLRVVVGSAKGGVGKTTIAAHLAAALGATLIDLDPEGSTRAMTDHGLTILYDAPPPGTPGRFVLDVPANTANNAARLNRAVQHATHVIIPMRPGDVELDRLENTLASLHGHVPPEAKVGVVLNFARLNAISRETLEVLDVLAEQSSVPFHVIGTLPDLVGFQRALTNGFRGTLGRPEMAALKRWVLR